MNIFEGLHRNIFFIGINMIMMGGQVLIIFIGGDAFEIERQSGREWGLAIGLGAISLPFGAAIRKFPDEWVVACIPAFVKRRWIWPPVKGPEAEKPVEDEDEFQRPPLRVMSSLRGARVQQQLGFREKMHNYKEKTKEKARGDKAGKHKEAGAEIVEKKPSVSHE